MRVWSDFADAQCGQAFLPAYSLTTSFPAVRFRCFVCFPIHPLSPGQNQNCRTELSATSGYITPPDSDDDGQYDYNLDCWWVFIGGEFQSVHLLIRNIDIEEKENCQSDKLEVSDPLNLLI